jgi:hypothetical protein
MIGGLAFLVLISASYEARAQGRGRDESKWDKKCAKFVNCHDASEGRVDGRGPRRGNDSDDSNWRRSRRDRDSDNFDHHRRIVGLTATGILTAIVIGDITTGTCDDIEPGVGTALILAH